jgi:RNA polymerase sigma-70 factor (ECF subfamily)
LVWLRTHQRRTRREQTAGRGAAAWFDPGACSPLESEEEMRRVQAALELLPTAQREVLVLHVWGELTFAEVAAVLKVSPNTAASRYRYALTSLRRQLGEEGTL